MPFAGVNLGFSWGSMGGKLYGGLCQEEFYSAGQSLSQVRDPYTEPGGAVHEDGSRLAAVGHGMPCPYNFKVIEKHRRSSEMQAGFEKMATAFLQD